MMLTLRPSERSVNVMSEMAGKLLMVARSIIECVFSFKAAPQPGHLISRHRLCRNTSKTDCRVLHIGHFGPILKSLSKLEVGCRSKFLFTARSGHSLLRLSRVFQSTHCNLIHTLSVPCTSKSEAHYLVVCRVRFESQQVVDRLLLVNHDFD